MREGFPESLRTRRVSETSGMRRTSTAWVSAHEIIAPQCRVACGVCPVNRDRSPREGVLCAMPPSDCNAGQVCCVEFLEFRLSFYLLPDFGCAMLSSSARCTVLASRMCCVADNVLWCMASLCDAQKSCSRVPSECLASDMQSLWSPNLRMSENLLLCY